MLIPVVYADEKMKVHRIAWKLGTSAQSLPVGLSLLESVIAPSPSPSSS